MNVHPTGYQVSTRATTSTEAQTYTYRVKIINQAVKRDSIIRDLRQFSGQFQSIIDMKVKLMEEFGEQLPPTTTFSLGYFAGRRSDRHWIYTEEDLRIMYKNCPTSDILLWCDSRSDNREAPKSKRRKLSDQFQSKREEKENRMETLAKELEDLNGKRLALDETQYKLWARMIISGIHSSKEKPPQVPMITGITPKRKSNLTAIVKATTNASVIQSTSAAIQSPVIQQTPSLNTTTTPAQALGVSPGKAADIRSKSLSQLSALKQLYDDNILTLDEFEEQKKIILSGLKKLL